MESAGEANSCLQAATGEEQCESGDGRNDREKPMANQTDFAKELNDLISRFIDAGSDPQDIVDELTREANLIFARHNLEIYLAARKSGRAGD